MISVLSSAPVMIKSIVLPDDMTVYARLATTTMPTYNLKQFLRFGEEVWMPIDLYMSSDLIL